MTVSPTQPRSVVSSVEVVEQFLRALTAGDAGTAAAMLTDDVAWHNVGWPTVRGKRRVVAALEQMAKLPGFEFTVDMHQIVGDGDVVLTERTDGLFAGPIGGAFWVCGTFELRDGKIAVWRDRFDLFDFAKGMVSGTFRGVLGRR